MGREGADSDKSWDTGYHDVSPDIRMWDTDRDIQEGMGLSDDKHKYNTIRVCPHMGLAIRM